MRTDRLGLYTGAAVLDRLELARAGAGGDAWSTDLAEGLPPHRIHWVELIAGGPGDPLDERYYGDEVRPAGVGGDGRLAWEAAPDGLSGVVVHNVAEAGLGTHALAAGTVVRVEARLDGGDPPDLVYLAHVPVPRDRLARVESYAGGSYTVQPVRREGGGMTDDGSPIAGVVNLGELWPEEAGYLAGPAAYDRYVRIHWSAAGWAMLVHPPRLM